MSEADVPPERFETLEVEAPVKVAFGDIEDEVFPDPVEAEEAPALKTITAANGRVFEIIRELPPVTAKGVQVFEVREADDTIA